MTFTNRQKETSVKNALYEYLQSISNDHDFHADTFTIGDLELDSIERMEFILYLEETFDITVDNDFIKDYMTLESLENELQRKFNIS